MTAVLFRLISHREKYLVPKTTWKTLFSTSGSRLISNKDPDRSTRTNRLKDEIPFESVKIKSGSLDHFTKALTVKEDKSEKSYTLPHPIWSKEEVDEVSINHRKPKGLVDWTAYSAVSLLRVTFDLLSGYKVKQRMETLDERVVVNRCIFLETVAGVPGFAAGMIRHLNSLRRMERDNGWIHTLIGEAENERMHLLTFLQLRQPGIMFRAAVILTQFIFTAGFCLSYLISPRFCHRFVGYLEDQAVVTYTDILEKLDGGKLPLWSHLPAPEIAINYWKLGNQAMMRDVILAIRADEAHHRQVNHTLGDLGLKKKNPFAAGE